MKNIFRIFYRDFKRVSTNVVAVVIVIGLSIIPSLYAWFNILSNWDPYGPESTSNLKIAVYSADEGIDMGGLSLNIGDSVIDALKANQTMGWQFTDTMDEATDGVYSSEYYAALIIPEDFSGKMISFLNGEAEPPAEVVDPHRVAQIVRERLVDEAGLAGGEHLLGLPEMLAPVVRLQADAVGGRDQRIDRRDDLDAHLLHLRDVLRIAVRRGGDVLRPPLVGVRDAEARDGGVFRHIHDLRERDRVARVEPDDADLGLRPRDDRRAADDDGQDDALHAVFP